MLMQFSWIMRQTDIHRLNCTHKLIVAELQNLQFDQKIIDLIVVIQVSLYSSAMKKHGIETASLQKT